MSTKRTRPTEKPDTVVKPAAAGKSTLAAMTDAALADQAKAWDEAREQLGRVTTAAAAAQAALDGLAPDASDDDRHDALVLLAEAENAVRDAEARIRELTNEGAAPNGGEPAPVSSSTAGAVADIVAAPADNHPTGAASATAHGGNASALPAPAAAEPGLAGDAVRSPATHTPESDDDGQGGAGREAGPAKTYRGVSRDDMAEMANEQVDIVVASVKAQIADGDREGALRHLEEERFGAELMIEVSKLVANRLKLAAAELGRSKTVWARENVMYAGVLHVAGGPSFQIEPGEFDDLQRAGVVTDTDPDQESDNDQPA